VRIPVQMQLEEGGHRRRGMAHGVDGDVDGRKTGGRREVTSVTIVF
jgi:hypothetical protein